MLNGRIFEIRIRKSISIKDLYYSTEVRLTSGL